MILYILAGILVFFAVLIVIFRFSGGWFRGIYILMALLLAFSINPMVFVLVDANDFKNNFATSPKLILLDNNGVIEAGFLLGNTLESEQPVMISEESEVLYNGYLENNNLAPFERDYYKTFVISKTLIEESNLSIQMGDTTITSEYIAREVSTDSNLFALFFYELVNTGSSTIIFEKFKQGQIDIIPETPLTYMVKILPLSLLEGINKEESK